MPVVPEIDWQTPVKLVDRPGLAEQYHLFDAESALAIRAALAARRPLLVRGEPGVGKTQLAAAAANVLKRPLVTKVVDSRTESRDLHVGIRCDHAAGGCPDRRRVPLREGLSR